MKCLAARFQVIALVLAIGVLSTACGGGASSTNGGGTSAITVSMTQSGSTTSANAGSPPVTLTAAISNDTSNAGVTWSVSPASGCGTMTSSGTTATYTTPAESSLVASCTATITAASTANSAKTAALAFTIKPVSITFPAGQSTTQTATAGVSNLPLSALIADDASGSATLNWTVSGASSSCGSLSSATGGSVTYIAPAGIACTATVKVAASVNAGVTKTFTINVSLPVLTASVTAANKIYDRTNTATISACTLAGVLSADTGNVSCSATGSFSSVNVGTGKAVAATGITLSGTAAGGYTLASATATTTANITARLLTVTAAADTKSYDGTVSSSGVPTLTGSLAGIDTATWTQTFDDKNLGTAHVLTPSGAVTDGNSGNNYSLTFVTISTGAITKRAVTVTAAASTKAYDGTTSSSVPPTITSGSLATGDTAAFAQTYDNINVGAAHVLAPSGNVTDGNGGLNYLAAFIPSNTGVITAKDLTASVAAGNKTYDGTITANVAACALTGVLSGDTSNVNCSATVAAFSDANAGAGKTVTATGISLSGSAAGNYALPLTTAATTASITARALTVTATSGTKIYDGNNSSSFTPTITLGSLSGSDTATWSQAYDTKNVGATHILTPAGTVTDGNSGNNYTVSFANLSTGVITPKSLTVTAAASTKTYDGTSSSSATPTITSGSLAAGDTAAWTQTYDNINIGALQWLTPAGTVSDGNGGNNYNAAFIRSNTGVITRKGLTASVAASDKVYDGGSVASINRCTLTGVLAAETIDINCSAAAGAFSDANVGAGKTVTATGISLSGPGSGNYALPLTTAATTASITAKALTVTATSGTKIYDGTTSSSGVPTITSGILAGTDAGTWTQTYGSKNVGAAHLLTPSGTVSDGNGGNNYNVNFATVNTGSITARPLTVTAIANTKTYDGLTNSLNVPTITVGSVVTGDTAALVQSYDNKNVGVAHVLTPTGTVTDGNGGGNYSVTFAPFNTGVITEKSLTASVTVSDKTFDGNNTAIIATCTPVGVLVAETSNVNCAALAATFSNANAGMGKTVTATGVSLGGTAAGNYTLPVTTATTTANITAEALTVTAVASTKMYDGNTSSSGLPTVTGGTLRGSDSATWSQTFDSKNIGNAHVLTPAGTVTDGNSGNNYSVNFVTYNSGVITAKGLTVTGLSAIGKIYDGITSAALSGTGTLVGAVGGDPVTLSGTPIGTFNSKNANTSISVNVTGFTLSGLSAGNYALTQPTGLTADITQKPLTVRADDKTMSVGAPVLPPLTVSYFGFVPGETSAVLGGSPILSTLATSLSPAGTYPITVTQGVLFAPNYSLTFQDGTLTVSAAIFVNLTPNANQNLDAGNSLQITPTVTNDGSNRGVNLSLNPPTGCGTLSASSAASGTAVTYSVPALNSRCRVTVTATSVSDSGKSASLDIDVNLALSLPAASPSLLPSATTNQNYNGGINAIGGGQGYTFTVNGTSVPTNGSLVSLTNGLSVSNTGGNTLGISGIPTTTAAVPLSVRVTDGTGATFGPIAYSISVYGPGFRVSGNVNSSNGSGGIPGVTISINSTPVQTTTTDNTGNFSFQGLQNATYTVTPSIATVGVSSIFFPAIQTAVVNNGDAPFVSFQGTLGYTVTGTVTYPTPTKTGRIYITLQSNSSCNNASFGTSIPSSALSSGGNFTIKGVCPGTYTLNAWMDTIGLGVPNGTNASGSTSGVAVPTGSNPNVILRDQANNFGVLNGPKVEVISPMSQGVMLFFKPVTADPNNDNSVEMPPQYRVQWSTDSLFPVGNTNETTIPATGGDQPSLLSSRTLPGFIDNTSLYFRVRGESLDGNTTKTLWTTPPAAVPIGKVIPTNPVTVSGKVNFSGGPTTGPLYVGCIDESKGILYGKSFAGSGSFPQAYSVDVDSGTGCFMFGVIDNNRNSVIDTGDASNTDGNGSNVIVVTGPTPQDIDLPSSKSVVSVTSSHFKSFDISSNNENFNLNFDLRGGLKLPVAMQMASGPNVLVPMDVAPQQSKKGGRFQVWSSVGNTRPLLTDTYGLNVTYSDDTTEIVNATGATVLDSFAQSLTVETTGSATRTTPTFHWAAPATLPVGGYTYQFWINTQNGNWQSWQVPGNNSKSNGIPSSTTSMTWAEIVSNNPLSPATLTSGTTYSWTVTVQDAKGNSAQAQVTYIVP